MEPTEPKRRRSQRLQQAATVDEGGGTSGPHLAWEPTAAAELEAIVADGTATAAAAADGSSTSCPFARILLPELLQRVAGFMERNEVACSLRLVCTAAAAALTGPRYTTVRLSEPSPPAAFALQWSRPTALLKLTARERIRLELLTARSGSIANLQSLAARGDLPLLSRRPTEWEPLLAAAAECGHVGLCAWLRQQGTPTSVYVVSSAAESGKPAVVQPLLDTDADGSEGLFAAACGAARRGHVQLLDWLLGRMQLGDLSPLLPASIMVRVAHGCSLGVLQRLHAQFFAGQPPLPQQLEIGDWQHACWVEGAAGSPTPDWQEKVEWLEALGCPRNSDACGAAARTPDAVARLQWLAGRGYTLGAYTAEAAADAGNTEALRYVLAQGSTLSAVAAQSMTCHAARMGRLAVAQVLLHAAGAAITPAVVEAAAEGGHLSAVEWAAEQLGAGLELNARLFRAAARSGSWPLLRWLHEHGCAWDASVFAAAVGSCSEEQLEWLVWRGCPMGVDGAAYAAPLRTGDLFVLRCLHRLGCPFAADGSNFTSAVQALQSRAHFASPLRWLLDAGCPVDWRAAMRVTKGRDDSMVHAWLQEQWQQRGGRVWGGRLRSARGGQGHSGPARR